METSTALQQCTEQHFWASSERYLMCSWERIPYQYSADVPCSVLEGHVAHRKVSKELCKRCLFNLNLMFCKLACLWKLLYMEYLLLLYRTHLGNVEVKTTNWEQRSMGCSRGSATNLNFSLFIGLHFPHMQRGFKPTTWRETGTTFFAYFFCARYWYTIRTPCLKRLHIWFNPLLSPFWNF